MCAPVGQQQQRPVAGQSLRGPSTAEQVSGRPAQQQAQTAAAAPAPAPAAAPAQPTAGMRGVPDQPSVDLDARAAVAGAKIESIEAEQQRLRMALDRYSLKSRANREAAKRKWNELESQRIALVAEQKGLSRRAAQAKEREAQAAQQAEVEKEAQGYADLYKKRFGLSDEEAEGVKSMIASGVNPADIEQQYESKVRTTRSPEETYENEVAKDRADMERQKQERPLAVADELRKMYLKEQEMAEPRPLNLDAFSDEDLRGAYEFVGPEIRAAIDKRLGGNANVSVFGGTGDSRSTDDWWGGQMGQGEPESAPESSDPKQAAAAEFASLPQEQQTAEAWAAIKRKHGV